MRRLTYGSHSALAFDSDNGLLVTSLLTAPAGIVRFNDRDVPERTYAQAWLRTPVARDVPRLARMVDDRRWELIDLQEHASCVFEPPLGVRCDRLVVGALSCDGDRAFGIVSADAAKHETMVLWNATTGEVVDARPTLGPHPTASFAQGAPVVVRLVDRSLEVWRWDTGDVQFLSLPSFGADLTITGTTAWVACGRRVVRYDLLSGSAMPSWRSPLGTVTALASRGTQLVVGAAKQVATVKEDGTVVASGGVGAARFVAVAPDGRIAASDGTNVVVFDA